jgi:hypothetical protein
MDIFWSFVTGRNTKVSILYNQCRCYEHLKWASRDGSSVNEIEFANHPNLYWCLASMLYPYLRRAAEIIFCCRKELSVALQVCELRLRVSRRSAGPTNYLRRAAEIIFCRRKDYDRHQLNIALHAISFSSFHLSEQRSTNTTFVKFARNGSAEPWCLVSSCSRQN